MVNLHFLNIKQVTDHIGQTYFGKGVFLHPTSGTYGKSSYCVRSQRGNVAEAINYLERISIYSRSSVMVLTPLHHAFGFGFGLISSILSDSNLILFPEFNPRIVLKSLKTEIIDILALVPPMLLSMVMIPEESGYKMARSVFFAGTPCPIALSERFLNVFNKKLYQIYGTTETGAIATSYYNGEVLSGVGKCLPNVEGGIFKDSTYEQLGENIGEVLIKSTSMMDCYTHYTIRKSDFWHTGDIGFFDSFNNLHLTSRVKDIINVGGSKVDPVEVEKVLLEHNLIIDAVAYPYIREDGKEMVQAAVVLRDGLISENELSRFCFEKISEYKVPVFFHFVDFISRTSSGKIKKMDLPDFPKKLLFVDPEK
jgi:long-chain acyl-CoA synthetase